MSDAKLGTKLSQGNRWERIWLLAKIEFKLRYYENKLGLLWALIKPVTQLVIYFVAFKIIMRNNIPDFAIFLFAGLVVWEFFVESTIGLTLILQTKKYLYEYSNMSKLEIYLASMLSISLGFAFNTFILLLFLIFGNLGVGWNILYLPLTYLVLFIFSFGVSLILSNLFVVAKDIHQVWPLASQAIMWVSPLFFSTEALVTSLPGIEYVNPMYGIMTNFRNVTMHDLPPDFYMLGINLLQGLIGVGVGLLLLRKIGNRASEIL